MNLNSSSDALRFAADNDNCSERRTRTRTSRILLQGRTSRRTRCRSHDFEHVSRRRSYSLLGTRCETRRCLDSQVCQVSNWRNRAFRFCCTPLETKRADGAYQFERTGCSRYCRRIHQSTTKMVERIVLRFDLCAHSYDATVRNSTLEETSFLFTHSSDLQPLSSRLRLVWIRKLCYLLLRMSTSL